MAQYAIIKQKTKSQSAQVYYDRIVAGDSTVCFFFGNPVSWTVAPGGSYNETTPPAPVDTPYCEKQIWDGIIGLKKITPSIESKLAFSRVDWVSGNYYDMYRDDYDGTVAGVSLAGEYVNTKPINLAKSNNLVLVNDSGTYKLYRCIDNRSTTTGNPVASTSKPTFTTTQIQTLVDGYKWKYMGSLSTGDVDDFLTTYHSPLPSTLGSTSNDGQVVSVVMTSRGAGYTSTPTVTVKGDGTGLVLGTPVVLAGAIVHIPVTTPGTGYTYVQLTISGGGTPTTTATARAIIAPTGGFANDLRSEINPNYVIMKVDNINTDSYFTTRGNAPLVYSTSGVTGLTYRTVGLIQDQTITTPVGSLFKEYRYTPVTGTLSFGDRLTTATSGLSNAVATVVGTRTDTSTVIETLTINAATKVNNTTHAVNYIGHALLTGDTLLYSNGGGTSIGGLTNNNTYYVIRVDADNFKLATSLSNAQSGSAISITTGVGASHTFTQNAVKYYVSLLRTTEQLIEATPLTTGNLLTRTDSAATIYLGPYVSFNGSSTAVVGVGSDKLTIPSHPFVTGDSVVYSNGGGTTISTTGSALVSGNTYYVIRLTTDEIKLATSYTNAVNGIAIDITAVGAGTNHSLTYTGSDYLQTETTTKYDGNIIFAEYRNPVTRSTAKEKFRFVLEF